MTNESVIHNAKILLVDDTPTNLDLLRKALTRDSYTISVATSGEEALKRCQEFLPDLILLDVMMPGMGGIETCRLLKATPALSKIPVIFVTAKTETYDIVEGFAAGAIDYVSKPIKIEEVRARVKTQLLVKKLTEAERHKDEYLLNIYGQAFEHSLEGMLIFDQAQIVKASNLAVCDMLAIPEGKTEPLSLKQFSLFKNPTANGQMWGTLQARGIWQSEQEIVNFRGDSFYAQLTVSQFVDKSDDSIHFMMIIRNITKEKLHAKALQDLLKFDSLTGLPNRVLLEDRIEQAIVRAVRDNEVHALFYIDLDDFMKINNSFGYAQGDELLKEVSTRIKDRLRQADTIARVSADEFVVLSRCKSDIPDIARIANKLMDCFKQPFSLQGEQLQVNATIGISVSPTDGTNGQQLLTNAESAMHYGKQTDINPINFYASDMNAQTLARLRLENDLREAIELGALNLHYQPKVNAKNHRVEGVEALVRWQHPEQGWISPADFIPLAEESGLIYALSNWVLNEACAQIRRWLDAGHEPISIAINLSAKELKQKDIVSQVVDALALHQIEPHWLELEITESAIIHDIDTTLNILKSLRKHEIRLAIDDFGTGYSSLNYLKRFPINTLKIDKSFIDEIALRQQDKSIVENIINLAHCLNLQVVAEGVEDDKQWMILKELGCEMIQGYCFSKPKTADAIESEYLKRTLVDSQA